MWYLIYGQKIGLIHGKKLNRKKEIDMHKN